MTRTILLVVHLLGVCMWLGANAVQLFMVRFFSGRPAEVRSAWVEATMALGTRYYNVAGGLIGAAGVGLVVDGDWPWSSTFIWVGVAALVIGAAMGVGVFVPLSARQLEAVRAGVSDSAIQRRIVMFALLDTAVVVTAMVSMIRKWG